MPSGSTTVDFGAYPGKDSTSVAITGQGAIGSGSLAEGWIFPVATADHTVEEHLFEEMQVMAGTVVAATGFTIYARTRNFPLYGLYTVAWAWA